MRLSRLTAPRVDKPSNVMARWEIEKVAVAHLLEALKVALDHLRDFTMTGQMSDFGSTRNGAATYAQLRRMRTYVQRCVSAYSDRVELDLNDDDQNLLVACAIFEIANLDRRLGGPGRSAGEDSEWLEERRRTLAHWSVAFATRKVEHIPVADESVFLTSTVQTVLREVQRRLVVSGQRSGLHRVTRETAGIPTMPTLPAEAGIDPHGGWPAPGNVAPQPAYGDPSWVGVPPGNTAYYQPHVAPPPHAAPPPHGGPPRAAHARGPSGGAAQAKGSREFGIPSPQIGAPQVGAPGAPAGGYPAAPAPVAHATPTPMPGTHAPEDVGLDAAAAVGLDLDPRKLHDPRVRSILLLDLRAFDRALRANDHRMCVVHLGSILEAVCIDYALAHRRELSLSGAPETWNLESIVSAVVGGEISSMDRALLFHLNAARNLLRPAIQLSNPMVVTAGTQGELIQFVHRVLALMGFVSPGEGAPPTPGTASQMGAAASARPGSQPSWMRSSDRPHH
ncbi:MAG: hypothetical protein R3F56_09710 [Planctomycetota bacterium]